MKTRKTNRLLAVFLCLCMVVGMLPMTALAERQATLGLCEHHLGHTAECGYGEGQACGYTCELCGELANEPVSKPGDEAGQTACTLTQGCTLADGHEGECVTELPPVDGAPVKTITNWTFVGDNNLNEGELPLTGVSIEQQADFDTVVSMLPTGISAEIKEETGLVPVLYSDVTCHHPGRFRRDGSRSG